MDISEHGVLLSAAHRSKRRIGAHTSATVGVLVLSNACAATLGGLVWAASLFVLMFADRPTPESEPLLGLIGIVGVCELPLVSLASIIYSWVAYARGSRRTAVVAALVPFLNILIGAMFLGLLLAE